MRVAILKCKRVDECAHIGDVAVAAQAYYRVTLDIDNEIIASNIRVRAERRLGELLHKMKARGERHNGRNAPNALKSRGATPTLADLGIDKHRASRAKQLADVDEDEFELALSGERVAQPRTILRATKKQPVAVVEPPAVPITHTLDLWGRVRDLGALLHDGKLPPLDKWRTNLQPFQLAHLRKYIPPLVDYLSAIYADLTRTEP
jgi:hypothetical protein